MRERIDIRKMPPEGQAVVREIIIRMKSNGSSIDDIISAVGCAAHHISYTWGKYVNARTKAEKEQIIYTDRRGREKGEGRTLSSAQEKRIQKLITNKYPDQ